MSEYTPTTGDMRKAWRYYIPGGKHSDPERNAEFDRWLERVRTEERERCAQIADAEGAKHANIPVYVGMGDPRWEQGAAGASSRIAAAIRAVSEQEEQSEWTDPNPWFYPVSKIRTAHKLAYTTARWQPRTQEQYEAEQEEHRG